MGSTASDYEPAGLFITTAAAVVSMNDDDDNDDVFFLACNNFRGMFDHSFPACSFFFSFFFEVEISSCTQIQLFMPESVHSGSAS